MLIVETKYRECCTEADFEPIGLVKDRNIPRHVRCKYCHVEWVNIPYGERLTLNGFGYSRFKADLQVDLSAYARISTPLWPPNYSHVEWGSKHITVDDFTSKDNFHYYLTPDTSKPKTSASFKKGNQTLKAWKAKQHEEAIKEAEDFAKMQLLINTYDYPDGF